MYLYLLENETSKKYYIGVTENIDRRIKEHNGKSHHYTGKNKGEWNILGVRNLDSHYALVEEKRLKKCKNKKYVLWYFTEGR